MYYKSVLYICCARKCTSVHYTICFVYLNMYHVICCWLLLFVLSSCVCVCIWEMKRNSFSRNECVSHILWHIKCTVCTKCTLVHLICHKMCDTHVITCESHIKCTSVHYTICFVYSNVWYINRFEFVRLCLCLRDNCCNKNNCVSRK